MTVNLNNSNTAEASFSFECSDNSGALLMLHPSGISTELLSRNRIVRYMRKHIDSWLELANDQLDLGRKEEELQFVSGTVKTC